MVAPDIDPLKKNLNFGDKKIAVMEKQSFTVTVSGKEKHKVVFDHLHMRQNSDFREDADVKEEIYITHIEKNAQVLFVVDDRKSVVERWRKLELVCLQCAPGNF